MNGGRPVLRSSLGTKGLRDPFIIRDPAGTKFYLIATDLKMYGGAGGNWDTASRNGSLALSIWESTNLKDWSAQRLVKVSPSTAGMVTPVPFLAFRHCSFCSNSLGLLKQRGLLPWVCISFTAPLSQYSHHQGNSLFIGPPSYTRRATPAIRQRLTQEFSMQLRATSRRSLRLLYGLTQVCPSLQCRKLPIHSDVKAGTSLTHHLHMILSLNTTIASPRLLGMYGL